MIIHDLVSAFGCRSDRNASEKLKQMFRIRVSRAGLVMLLLFGTLPLTSRTGGQLHRHRPRNSSRQLSAEM